MADPAKLKGAKTFELQSGMSLVGVTVGVGLTVIVKLETGPLHEY